MSSRAEIEELVRAYFDSVSRKDWQGLLRLFTNDAQVVDDQETMSGAQEIAERYRDRFFSEGDIAPLPGRLIADGDRAAVELQVEMGEGTRHVADFFTFSDGKISRLVVYRWDWQVGLER